ncbi:MAG: hypothetical protein AAF602_07080 [Myxococcota bacterium]
MRGGWWLGLAVMASGCELIEGAESIIQPPTGEFVGVELVKAPDLLQVVAWQCSEQGLGVLCAPIGPRPRDEDLVIGFDLDFDIENPNVSVPVPLTEALVGLTVFDTTNLGSVCVSFCDTLSDEDCEAGTNEAGACEGGTGVLNPGDLLATVPELLTLSEADDGTYDNDGWRTILAGSTTRVTMGFELAPDTVLSLGESLISGLLDDVLAGQAPTLAIPFSTEGTLFFEVPEIGRRAIGFGPFDDQWTLELPKEE